MGILQVLRFEFRKFGILDFHTCKKNHLNETCTFTLVSIKNEKQSDLGLAFLEGTLSSIFKNIYHAHYIGDK